jgi:two-component system OmpR family response regulator
MPEGDATRRVNSVTELRTILYVEDDPDIQSVAEMALVDVGGFEVRMASSGADALRMAQQEPPDLILLDVMMPDMDGPATLVRMRAIEALIDVPVVFVTAKVQASEVASYVQQGAIGVIAKPFNAMTLSAQVRDLWDAHSARD